MIISLRFDNPDDLLKLVELALYTIVSLRQFSVLASSLVNSELRTLQLLVKTILLMEMLVPLKLEHLDAIGKGEHLLASRFELGGSLAVLALELSVLTEERPKLAVMLFGVESSGVTLAFTDLQPGVGSF